MNNVSSFLSSEKFTSSHEFISDKEFYIFIKQGCKNNWFCGQAIPVKFDKLY